MTPLEAARSNSRTASWAAAGPPAWPASIARRACRTLERARVRTRALRSLLRLFCLTLFLADLVFAKVPPDLALGQGRAAILLRSAGRVQHLNELKTYETPSAPQGCEGVMAVPASNAAVP